MSSLLNITVPYSELLLRRYSGRHFNSEQKLTSHALLSFLSASLAPVGATKPRLPAAGGIYDYQFFLNVNKCQGLESGLYHYDQEQEHIHSIPSSFVLSSSLTRQLSHAISGAEADAALIVITLHGKYRQKYGDQGDRLAYANAGVLIGHFYLIATAMKLAGCAVGWLDLQILKDNLDNLPDEFISGTAFCLGEAEYE